MRFEDRKITDIRLTLGSVAAEPWRFRATEKILIGATSGSETYQRAAKVRLADATPFGDNAFKIEMAQRILVRALALATAGTPTRISALPASPFSSVSEVLINS
jgi:xanthine dehydrogenase YagS FAD-binding subunit